MCQSRCLQPFRQFSFVPLGLVPLGFGSLSHGIQSLSRVHGPKPRATNLKGRNLKFGAFRAFLKMFPTNAAHICRPKWEKPWNPCCCSSPPILGYPVVSHGWLKNLHELRIVYKYCSQGFRYLGSRRSLLVSRVGPRGHLFLVFVSDKEHQPSKMKKNLLSKPVSYHKPQCPTNMQILPAKAPGSSRLRVKFRSPQKQGPYDLTVIGVGGLGFKVQGGTEPLIVPPVI